jgi:hypothetical protein
MHCAAIVVFSSVYIGVCLPKMKWKSWNERYVLLSNYYCNDMLWREDQCSALSLDSISCMYEFILLMHKVCVVVEKSELVSMHCAVVVFSSVYIGVCLGCCFIYFGLSICHCWWCAYCNLSIWWYLWGAFDNMQPWLSLFCDLLLHTGGAFPYVKPGNISISLLFCVFFRHVNDNNAGNKYILLIYTIWEYAVMITTVLWSFFPGSKCHNAHPSQCACAACERISEFCCSNHFF